MGLPGVPEHVGGSSVDQSVTSAAALVRGRARVPDTRDDEAVLDPANLILVERQPCDRPDRPWDEQEAVRVAERQAPQMLGEPRRERDARQVVVGDGWVAAVTRDEDLGLGLAGQVTLPVRQAPRLEGGVDPHGVLAVLERLELLVLHAESPRLRVVGRAVRDEVRLVGERVDVLLQLGQGHACVDRHAVAHDVEVAVREVDDAAPTGILDVGVSDVPFLRDGPVEDLGARRDLMQLQGDPFADPAKGLADPVAGDAPADREQLLHEPEHLGPDTVGIEVERQVAHD